jgi:hypothetical protein
MIFFLVLGIAATKVILQVAFMTWSNITVNTPVTVGCTIGSVACPTLMFTPTVNPVNTTTNTTVSWWKNVVKTNKFLITGFAKAQKLFLYKGNNSNLAVCRAIYKKNQIQSCLC